MQTEVGPTIRHAAVLMAGAGGRSTGDREDADAAFVCEHRKTRSNSGSDGGAADERMHIQTAVSSRGVGGQYRYVDVYGGGPVDVAEGDGEHGIFRDPF